MTTFMTIMMMVLFFNVLGFFFRIGWKILCGILGFIGFLIIAGLTVGFVGMFFLPLIAMIALTILAVKNAGRV